MSRGRYLQYILIIFVIFGCFSLPKKARAHQLRGWTAVQARLFVEPPLQPEQEHHAFSWAASPEYYHRFSSGDLFTFKPFARLDSADSERTHFDIRDLSYLYTQEHWEARVGISKVFWGVAESLHLVDIVNQTDLVENPDGEEKLGQPMINLVAFSQFGTFEAYILPYFRERTFPGKEGRLRFAAVVDTDRPLYESGAEEEHIDFAFRYFKTIGKLDFGLSYFIGTSRDPLAVPELKGGEVVIRPLYEQIQQTGMDMLYITGNWIWKFEGIYRTGLRTPEFWAGIGGFEYTFPGIWGTGMALGVLVEYMRDGRGEELVITEDDVTLGLRLGINDVQGTSILMAMIQDLNTDSRFPFIEATARLSPHWRMSVEYRGFVSQPLTDLLLDLKDDDFFEINLAYYF